MGSIKHRYCPKGGGGSRDQMDLPQVPVLMAGQSLFFFFFFIKKVKLNEFKKKKIGKTKFHDLTASE